MGEYRHTETGAVKTQGEWRRHYSNTSLPRVWTAATLQGLKLEAVLEAPKPTTDRTQRVIRDGVKRDSKNNWVTAWRVEAKSTEELAREDESAGQSVRSQRNALLAESDWTQVPDAPVDQAAWRTYRQALRDVTTQPGFPYGITWPVKPE